MAKSEAMIGYGFQVFVTKAGGTRTELKEVKDIKFPQASVDEIEVTHMNSPNKTKEYISGFNDNGEVSVPMNWVIGSPTDLLLTELQESGETVELEFVYGTTLNKKYSAFVKTYDTNAPVGEALTAEATFRVSGKITTP